LKLIPKKPFTWMLLAVIAYGYISFYTDDSNKTAKNKSDIAVVPGDKGPGFMDKPVDMIIKKISQTDTGKAIVSSIVEQTYKKEHGDKDVSVVSAQNNNRLQILDIVKGEGPVALCGSTVTVNYESFTENNLKLYSTIDKKSPVTFKIGSKQVIKGLENGVVGMKKGGERKLAIPSSLAYDDPDFASDIAGKGKPVLFNVNVIDVRNGMDINSTMTVDNISEGRGDTEVLCSSEVDLTYKIIEKDKDAQAKPLKFKMDSGTVPVGIERGVLGMRKGAVRRLTLPHEMLTIRGNSALPADFPIPKDAMLVVEVEVKGL
jgi:FKBP-type peptidyl-prolyl cis-trans isomerase